jgi:roadblock/LC7 domain-containing protein
MLDVWYTFPTQMGDHRAFITYNHGYAEVAEKERRDFLLKVRVEIKKPTSGGMPTNEEFPSLSAVDEKLDDSLTMKGAVYVGRITVDGHRYFHFYVDMPEKSASETIDNVSAQTSYKLQYSYTRDTAKDGYWKDLYPTSDDWQVIQDMKVLDALKKNGDMPDRPREVFHWAYFLEMKTANKFGEWAKSNHYKLISVEFTEGKKQVGVRFSHMGTMVLEDITHHTIGLNRKAKEMNGDYDGWETSVEK